MVVEFLLPLAWLLFVSFSFGFALTREKNLMSLGFGLALFAVFSIVFNLLGIPLNWLLFLAIAIVLLGYAIWKKELELEFEKPDKALLLVLLMAFINFVVYYAGATSFPWLEDDDPWNHAVGTKWVAETGSFSRYFDGEHFYRLYIEPYPPVYDVLMGLMHQMTESVSGTLKFFNAFLIALTLVMAFFAIEALTKDRHIALLATFFLLAMPAFMGHFIWAQTLAMLFLFVAFYALERSLEDRRFIIPAGLAIGAIAITQPSVAVTFVLMAGLYALVKLYSRGKDALRPILLAGLVGVLVTAAFYVPTYLKYGHDYTVMGIGFSESLLDPTSTADTAGGAVYSIDDYLFVKPFGKIDQHVGIGLVLSLLMLGGLALGLKQLASGKAKAWLIIAVLWLVLGFLGTEGNALPIKLFPHRFWVFLAIPVAMLASFSYIQMEERFEKYRGLLLVMMVAFVFLTSAAPKMEVQLAQWPPGASFTSTEELSGYYSLGASFEPNTRIFPLCSDDGKVIGFDMLSEPYVPEYETFKRDAINKTPSEVHSFLSERDYSYLVFDSTCSKEMGAQVAPVSLMNYQSSDKFQLVSSNGGFFLFQVK